MRKLLAFLFPLVAFALLLSPQVRAAEKVRWQFFVITITKAGPVVSVSVAESEAECDSMMMATANALSQTGLQFVVACNELKPVAKIPDGVTEIPSPKLKKDRDA